MFRLGNTLMPEESKQANKKPQHFHAMGLICLVDESTFKQQTQ